IEKNTSIITKPSYEYDVDFNETVIPGQEVNYSLNITNHKPKTMRVSSLSLDTDGIHEKIEDKGVVEADSERSFNYSFTPEKTGNYSLTHKLELSIDGNYYHKDTDHLIVDADSIFPMIELDDKEDIKENNETIAQSVDIILRVKNNNPFDMKEIFCSLFVDGDRKARYFFEEVPPGKVNYFDRVEFVSPSIKRSKLFNVKFECESETPYDEKLNRTNSEDIWVLPKNYTGKKPGFYLLTEPAEEKEGKEDPVKEKDSVEKSKEEFLKDEEKGNEDNEGGFIQSIVDFFVSIFST
ncbi:MAG: hypothetical protein ACQEP1_06815, partial [Nanobdellota archaeon]